MSKFQIDLNNYPEIQRLFYDDKQKFGEVLTKIMNQINDALLEQRFNYAEQVYKMDYLDMMQELSDAFFKVDGIAGYHHSNAEKEGLRGLAEDLHPLAIFTNGTPVYDAQGNNISPNKWLEVNNFSFRNWLYALFYGARFVSWHELAEYLMLGEYELIDALKVQNFDMLAKIQPALQYQKENNMPVGKLIAGAGLFDGGNSTTKKLNKCPACANAWSTHHDKYAYCKKCKLGGLK